MWLDLVNIDGASWLISILFGVLKAVYGFLATLDSVGYNIYYYYDIRNKKLVKKALETAVNQRKYLRESKMYGP